MSRRRIGRSAAAALAAVAFGRAAAGRPASDFAAFSASLWPEAERAGVPRPLFDATFAGLIPDPTVEAMTRRQPEFVKPIGAYIEAQVTSGRVGAGRAKMARWAGELGSVERRFGVPPAIVVAIWGLETNYGAASGNKDVIRSMATLAALAFRPDLYRMELIAALKMLSKDEVARAALRGSWAGAMGQPQFMPSSFESFAVDADGDGRRDIWSSVPDSLASIGNFIRSKGWQADAPWGLEVDLPSGLDYRLSRGSLADWAALGLTRAGGAPLPATGSPMILFFPSGSTGPAFLVTENFEVLKTYNSSDAYVLSVAQLADRLEDRAPIRAVWPTDVGMAKPGRIALQSRLAALGLPVDNREGRISLALRDTIRLAQARVGLVPDGNPTDELLTRLGRMEAQP